MAQSPASAFFWGANGAKLTPEQIALQRALLARKNAQGVDTSPVGHWTAGAARVADALADVIQERRLNKADDAAKAEDSALSAPLIRALTGQSASIPMTGAAGEVAATSPRPATVPQTADADYIRNGLIKRGFSPQVSDAFLANFQDESGLNAGINEANPTVPGSRGGFGLYQLTGPRRTAYEAFANERGVPVNDVDAQLDFLKYETEGPEAKAASTFLNAPDTATAAQAIVNNFLRPAPEHRSARAAAYAGLPSVQTAPVAPVEVASLDSPQTATDAIAAQSPMPQAVAPSAATAYAPQQAAPELPTPTEVAAPPAVAAQPPVQVAQAPQAQFPQVPQVAPQALAAAIQAANSPYASPQTKSLATALIQRQQAAQQAQQEQATWLARQQYEADQQAADPLRQAQIAEAQIKLRQMQDPNANLPDSFRALQLRAQASGLQPGTPEYNSFIQTQGVRAPATIAPPPTGYRYVYDQNQNPVSLEVIPGSPQALAEQQAATKAETAQEARDTTTDVVTTAAQRARDAFNAPGLPSTGTLGALLSGIPETNAAELRRQIGPLRAIASFETLNQLRAASPTGGALGSVTESEHKLLQDKAGALDPSSPNFTRDLEDYERTVLKIVHGDQKGEEIYKQTRKAEQAVEGKENAPEGVDPVLWQHMTPEEKKLWQ